MTTPSTRVPRALRPLTGGRYRLLGVLGRPNVIVTPHVAWASAEAMQTLWDQTISHIDNFHAGRPSNTLT